MFGAPGDGADSPVPSRQTETTATAMASVSPAILSAKGRDEWRLDVRPADSDR